MMGQVGLWPAMGEVERWLMVDGWRQTVVDGRWWATGADHKRWLDRCVDSDLSHRIWANWQATREVHGKND
jgi:hypothetical protein